MNKYLKFGLLMAAIIATLGWLAIGGIQESKTYYKEISELQHMGDGATSKRLRVGGDVEQGSIQRSGREVGHDGAVDTARQAHDDAATAQDTAHLSAQLGRDFLRHSGRVDAQHVFRKGAHDVLSLPSKALRTTHSDGEFRPRPDVATPDTSRLTHGHDQVP